MAIEQRPTDQPPVALAAVAGGVVCGGFDVPVSMSTLSHHLKVLRESGLLRVTPDGSFRRHELRLDEVEARFPGVLSAVARNVVSQPPRWPAGNLPTAAGA
jgi:hypothetical protein